MNNARQPTVQETIELIQYYTDCSYPHGTSEDANVFLQERLAFLNDLWIAVFDAYVTRGFQGKMAIVIELNGVVERLFWENGAICSFLDLDGGTY